MPKPKWEKDFTNLPGVHLKVSEFVIIHNFIRTQLEGVIDSIPDVVMLAGGDGDEISALTLKDQLRKEWLGESKN